MIQDTPYSSSAYPTNVQEQMNLNGSKNDSTKKIYKKCGNKSNKLGTSVDRVPALGKLIQRYMSSEEDDKTETYFEKILPIRKKNYNKLIHDLFNQGITLAGQRKVEKAIEKFNDAAVLADNNGDERNVGVCYCQIGNCYSSIGQYHKAIMWYKNWLTISIKLGNDVDAARAHEKLGDAYTSKGNYDKAKEHLEKSRLIYTETGNLTGLANTYCNLGNLYHSKGSYDKAINYHEQCLKIRIGLNDRDGIGSAKAFGNLGMTYNAIGNYSEAITYHSRAIDLFLKNDAYKLELASLYGNLGISYHNLGKWTEAIEYLNKSLNIYKDLKYRPGEAVAYGNLGNTYECLGELKKALYYNEKALTFYKDTGIRNREAGCYGNIGNVYTELGQYEKAIKYHTKGLNISKESGNVASQGQAFCNLGNAYSAMGDHKKAEEYALKHLKIAEKTGSEIDRGIALSNLGVTYIRTGKYKEAIKLLEECLKIIKQSGSKPGTAKIHYNIGYAYDLLGNLTEAYKHHNRAVEIGEELMQAVIDGKLEGDNADKINVLYFNQFSRTYNNLVSVLWKQGHFDEALLACDRGRARARNEIFAGGIHDKIDLSKQMSIQDIIDLSKGRTIVVFSLTDEPSPKEGGPYEVTKAIYIWVISAGRLKKIGHIRVEIPPDLDLELESFTVPTEPPPDKDSKLKNRKCDRINTLKSLYDCLINPIETLLPSKNSKETVVFVSGFRLSHIPLQALMNKKGEYLFEKIASATVSSIQTLSLLRKLKKQHQETSPSRKGDDDFKTALVMGPQTFGSSKTDTTKKGPKYLKYAELEANRIAKNLGCTPILLEKCTKKRIMAEMVKSKYIHLATHNDLSSKNDDSHLIGGILLHDPDNNEKPSKDCTLYASEIADMDLLHVDLVVLSCCGTGRGRLSSDGVGGLVRAFMSAGARSVIATLWSIKDNSITEELMVDFWKNYSKKNMSKVESLQKAMISVLKKKKQLDPLELTSYVLFGDTE